MSTNETTAPRHREMTHVGTGPRSTRLFDLELDPARTRYHALRRGEATKQASVRRCSYCGLALAPNEEGPRCEVCERIDKALTTPSVRPSLVTRLRDAFDGWWRGKTDGGLA